MRIPAGRLRGQFASNGRIVPVGSGECQAPGRRTRVIEGTGSTGWSELTATDWSNLTTSGWSGLGVSAGEQARVTWSYDPTGQLLAEARSGANAYRTTYVYDPSGNRTVEITETNRTTSVYDGANRLLASNSFSGNTTYSYDPAGNRTRLETPALELTTYTWNAENQLTQIELPAGDVVTHVWSPVNKNAEERIVEQDDGVTVTRFLWDNNNVVRETDEVGAVEAEYTYQPEPFGDLVSQRRDTDSSFYRFDALGSTTGLTDATGAVTDDYRYQAFGEPVETTGATENPYRWVGQVGYRYEDASSLYNLRARDYDPVAGRFVSQDPLGLGARDANFYRYVENAPAARTDASGLESTAAETLALWAFQQFLQSNPSESAVVAFIQEYATTEAEATLLWDYYLAHRPPNTEAEDNPLDSPSTTIDDLAPCNPDAYDRYQQYCSRLHMIIEGFRSQYPPPWDSNPQCNWWVNPIDDYCDPATPVGLEIYRQFFALSEEQQQAAVDFADSVEAWFEQQRANAEFLENTPSFCGPNPHGDYYYDLLKHYETEDLNNPGIDMARRWELLHAQGSRGQAILELFAFANECAPWGAQQRGPGNRGAGSLASAAFSRRFYRPSPFGGCPGTGSSPCRRTPSTLGPMPYPYRPQRPLRPLGGSGGKGGVAPKNIKIDPNVAWSPKGYKSLDSNGLPPYDEIDTLGRLVVGGQTYYVKNGQGSPGMEAGTDPSIKAGAISHTHAEGHAAMIIRKLCAKEGTLFINNPNGPCGYCDKVIENILPQNSTLTVIWPSGNSHTYIGNAK